MTTRMTRAAAAAAAQTELDTAMATTLPSSPAISIQLNSSALSSPLATKRSASGSKAPIVLIAEDADADARPGSPVAPAANMVLKPRSQAKQLLAKERTGMRASSNKENMKPEGAVETEETGNVLVTARIEAGTADTAAESTTTAEATPATEQSLEPVAETTPEERTPDSTAATTGTIAAAANTKHDTHTRPARRTSQVPPRRTSTATIPHSAPRPMSLSFPPPPAPIKSSKPSTRPTFALPGEAVAARLKAAKEARLASSGATPAEEPKRAAFKARPAPKMRPDAGLGRHAAASRAREGLMHPSRVAEQKDRRVSSVIDRRQTMGERKPERPASVAGAGAGRRPSLPAGGGRTDKGREIFNRAAQGLAEQARLKKEKEDVARKARAEAAERGRLLSKEWAEKQKVKAAKKGRVSEAGK